MSLEYKALPLSGLTVLDDDNGIVEAYVSVTGIIDRVRDNIKPGAYEKSLSTRRPKGVWGHDWNTPISKTLEAKEMRPGDPDLPKTLPDGSAWPPGAGAVKVKMQFNTETTAGRDAYSNVKFFGADQEWSIGYQVPKGQALIDTKSGVRGIQRLEWYEYSPVLFGAMPFARTLNEKTFGQDHKDVQIAYKSLVDAVGEVKAQSMFTPEPDIGNGVESLVDEWAANTPGEGQTVTDALNDNENHQGDYTSDYPQVWDQQEEKAGQQMSTSSIRLLEQAAAALTQAGDAIASMIGSSTGKPRSTFTEQKNSSAGSAAYADETSTEDVTSDDEMLFTHDSEEMKSLKTCVAVRLEGYDLDDETKSDLYDAAAVFDSIETKDGIEAALSDFLDVLEPAIDDATEETKDALHDIAADCTVLYATAQDEFEAKGTRTATTRKSKKIKEAAVSDEVDPDEADEDSAPDDSADDGTDGTDGTDDAEPTDEQGSVQKKVPSSRFKPKNRNRSTGRKDDEAAEIMSVKEINSLLRTESKGLGLGFSEKV